MQRYVLNPLRLQTGGSIAAGKLAVRHGWGLNIGGGFHHCCAQRGGGFCAFADITLLIKVSLFSFNVVFEIVNFNSFSTHSIIGNLPNYKCKFDGLNIRIIFVSPFRK